ncbi:MAG: hypothetical protein RSA87_03415 [Malacoplasma sp.]
MANNVNKKSKNKNNTPWFKKKASIIAMSSTLCVAMVATAITVPLVLISSNIKEQQAISINSIKTYCNKTTKDVKLVISGKNLPEDESLYTVYSVTLLKTTNVPQRIRLSVEKQSTQIALDFNDATLSEIPQYKVVVKGSSSSGQIVSTPSDISPFPSTSIVQPADVTLFNGESLIATLSVDPTVINPIADVEPSYQWQQSNSATGTFADISGATNKSYEYDATNIGISRVKTYFKCIVNYKYAQPSTFNPIFVEVIDRPIIRINTQPTSETIVHANINKPVTFTVDASISANPINGEVLSYQWYAGDKTSEGIDWNPQVGGGGTNSTFTYNQTQHLTPGVKKYFRCEIIYKHAISVFTDEVYLVKNLPPTISIVSEPQSVAIPLSQMTVDLNVDVKVENPIVGEKLSYLWMVSNVGAEIGWSVLGNQNHESSSYTYNVNSSTFPLASGEKRYFKCIITYPSVEGSLPLTTTPIFIERLAQ